MAEKSNVVLVREFLNLNSNNKVTMPEMAEFWKSCSAEEKVAFAASAKTALEAAALTAAVAA